MANFRSGVIRMTNRFDWHELSKLPDVSQIGLKNYFLYAAEPGGFLMGILRNDSWTSTIARADFQNKTRLHEYALWLQEFAPPNSWGSPETVRSWLNKGPAFEEFQKTIMWDALAGR